MLEIIFLITYPVRLYKTYSDAGVEGCAPYILGIIGSVLLGDAIGLLVMTQAFGSYGQNIVMFFIIGLVIIVAGYIVAGVLYQKGIKKCDEKAAELYASGFATTYQPRWPQSQYGGHYNSQQPGQPYQYGYQQPYYGQQAPYGQSPYGAPPAAPTQPGQYQYPAQPGAYPQQGQYQYPPQAGYPAPQNPPSPPYQGGAQG